jgi:hypothetical protein
VSIAWNGTPGSGVLLVDEAIFGPWVNVDGTYWMPRYNAAVPVPALVEDEYTFSDTGGAPGTGKVQWWNWVANLGYLPSSGVPTFADPA